jgi:hypothetical protein
MLKLDGRLLVATSRDTLDQPAYFVIDLLDTLKILTSARVLAAFCWILLPEDGLRSLLLPIDHLRLTGKPLSMGLKAESNIAIDIHLGQLEVVALGVGGLFVLDEAAPAEGLCERLPPL